jgi:hypothetical protein
MKERTMNNEKLIIYGALIFTLFFGIPKDTVGSRTRKKIIGQVKKWLAINGKHNPNITFNEYVQLVKDGGNILASVHDTMSLEGTGKFNHIDPAKFLAGLLKKVPELEVFEISQRDIAELEEIYKDSNLGFPTLMFLNRLIPLVDGYETSKVPTAKERTDVMQDEPFKVKINGVKVKVRSMAPCETINERTICTTREDFRPLSEDTANDVGYRLFKSKLIGESVGDHPDRYYYEIVSQTFDMSIIS